MNETEVIIDELKQKIFDFLSLIQTTKEIDRNYFKSIQENLEFLMINLQGLDLVSKSFLNEIYLTIKILQS